MVDNFYQGLTAAEVAERVARGQVNRVPRSDWGEYRTIAARNLFTLFNALVVPAAVALFLLADYRAAWAVSAMAIINSTVGLVQEVRAKRHLDRLVLLAETQACVRRDGTVCTIPAGEVVLDDLMLLATGEPVVADGTILESRFLEIDEALLTGESDPVPRSSGQTVLSGSFCVAGEGAFRAEKVGGTAFAQYTSAQARRYQYTASPLQRIIDLFIRILTATAVLLCLLYVVLWYVRGFTKDELVRMVAATVTSMVPQGLVLMTTLAFTLGAVRMSRRGAVVQRLNAVESMAAVEVLCMDKTGTLTTNQLTLARLQVLGPDRQEDEVRSRLRLFAWASLDERNKSIQALRTALGALPAEEELVLLDQVPFKSQNRFSAVHVRLGNEERLLVLGAFDGLRRFLSEPDTTHAETAWRDLLPTGLRLLLFAEGPDLLQAANLPAFQGALPDIRLRPLALVGLTDELRPQAGAVLEELARQGLVFKILSGDHPETVRATVAHLHLSLAAEPVVGGDQLAAARDPMVFVREHNVFGRVTPQQKLEIITIVHDQGHQVAMIGDGVNDILPIKRADLGIAMGEGSPATKTVAGLVLQNNNFELLPATLDEGRTIVHNIRRAAKLFLLKNVYTLLLILVAQGLLGLPFPYQPQHVTLLDFLTIGMPVFLLMLGRHPSGQPIRPGFLREVGWFVLPTGLVMGLAALLSFLLSAWWRGEALKTQQTMLLSTLIVLGLANMLRVLGDQEGRGGWADICLCLWLLVALLLYAGVMYLPWTRNFFELTALSLRQWGLVLAVAVPALALTAVIGAWSGGGGLPGLPGPKPGRPGGPPPPDQAPITA